MEANYKEAMELLDKILKIEFPGKPFTEKNKEFLIEYSILKSKGETKKPNEILKNIKEDITAHDTYMKQYPYVQNAKDKLQECFDRFGDLYDRDEKPFDDSFIKFLKWWYGNTDESGERHCYYCGVKETDAKSAFKNKKISSDKRSFSGTLQIDRKDSDGKYDEQNCVFACVLCNNAKSDMISAEDFENYFGKAIGKFWEHLK